MTGLWTNGTIMGPRMNEKASDSMETWEGEFMGIRMRCNFDPYASSLDLLKKNMEFLSRVQSSSSAMMGHLKGK